MEAARCRSCRIPARSHPLAVHPVDLRSWGPLGRAQEDEILWWMMTLIHILYAAGCGMAMCMV